MNLKLQFILALASVVLLEHFVASSDQKEEKRSLLSWVASKAMPIQNTAMFQALMLNHLTAGEGTISTDVRRVGFIFYFNKDGKWFNETLEYGDKKRLLKSHFNPKLPLVVLTHGFMVETEGNGIVNYIRQAYYDEGYNFNIIGTDWSALSTPTSIKAATLYPLAAGNVMRVGERVAGFLVFLKKHKMIRGGQDIHLIGHSLGAHVSGMAGYHYRLKTGESVERISGLDPAGPNFQEIDPNSRLDKTDAKFVDITHSDKTVFGYDGELGHVDFYPNGGGPIMPDCGNDLGICSHSDAYKYYAQSIRRTLTACRCNIQAYEDPAGCMRMCKDPIIYGERCPNTARGEYYFKLDVDDNK